MPNRKFAPNLTSKERWEKIKQLSNEVKELLVREKGLIAIQESTKRLNKVRNY